MCRCLLRVWRLLRPPLTMTYGMGRRRCTRFVFHRHQINKVSRFFRLIDRPRRFDKRREFQSANRAVEFNFSRKAANVGRCYCSGRSLFGSLMEKWNFRNEKNSCDVAGCPIQQPPLITLETRFS
jgi:hypothetical protein